MSTLQHIRHKKFFHNLTQSTRQEVEEHQTSVKRRREGVSCLAGDSENGGERRVEGVEWRCWGGEEDDEMSVHTSSGQPNSGSNRGIYQHYFPYWCLILSSEHWLFSLCSRWKNEGGMQNVMVAPLMQKENYQLYLCAQYVKTSLSSGEFFCEASVSSVPSIWWTKDGMKLDDNKVKRP